MPTIPWMPGAAADEATADSGQAVVMASKFHVTSLLQVPRFFLLSLVVWKQVRSAPGVIGASLRAEPLKKTFWTLSAWSSQEALDTFSRSEPHAGIMRPPAQGDGPFGVRLLPHRPRAAAHAAGTTR